MSALGLLLGQLLIGLGDDADAPGAGWRTGVELATAIIGPAVMVVGSVLLVRSGLWGARWKAPTAVLTRHQRKALSRQVMGKAPLDRRRLRLARDLAERTIRTRVVMLLYVGVLITQIGEAIGEPSTWRLWFTGGLVLVYVATLVIFEVCARRARRFLRLHPGAPLLPGPSS